MTSPRRKPITFSITVLALCAMVTWLMPPSMAAGDFTSGSSSDDQTMAQDTAQQSPKGKRAAEFLTSMMQVLDDFSERYAERQSSPFVPTPGQGGTPPGRPDHEPGSGKPDDRPPAHAPGQNKDKDKDKDDPEPSPDE